MICGRAFETGAATDLREFFQQWTTRTGAPVLSVDNVQVQKTDAGFVVSGLLRQAQDADPYVTAGAGHRGDDQRTSDVGRETECARTDVRRSPSTAAPLSLHVDPMFDLFRLLDPRETPASIGQIFGEPQNPGRVACGSR